jgi:phosphoenolpyruvate carboxylase
MSEQEKVLSEPEKKQFPRNSHLLEQMKAGYKGFCKERGDNPFYSPVLRLSLSVNHKLQNNEISEKEITEAIRILTQEGLLRRAESLAEYLGNCNPEHNEANLEILLRDIMERNGGLEDFDAFRQSVEKVYYGFVFTAHPTFNMTRELSRALANHAAVKGGAGTQCDTETDIFSAAEIPFRTPGLYKEAEFSLEAIDNLQNSILKFYEITFRLAREIHPDRWAELRPRLCTIATWVGFDLDGRNDINWTATIAARLNLQIRQLENFGNRLQELLEKHEHLTDLLQPAVKKIERALVPFREHLKFFEDYEPGKDPGHNQLQKASRDLIASAPVRMLNPGPLKEIIEKALDSAQDDRAREKLLLLLTQMQNSGLGCCEVHFRINAAQIHNAIRKDVELTTHPADPRYRQTYMERLLKIYRSTSPGNIHFGNILGEEASALRLFMLIQQVLKHIDNHTPVRFLIAETESSFTLMAALHFARRFGMEDKVDICPLLETERALTRGGHIIDHLLEIPEFRDYLRKRGRMCIQAGFSDLGRYIGQTPAAASIERLKEKAANLFDDYNMKDVSLLFFDTHGESTGRGGHPENMHQRMAYITPSHFLNSLQEKSITYIQESTYQGGDGYLYFMSENTSLAALARIMEYWLTPRENAVDCFYENKNGVREFLTIVKTFQEDLMQNPDYGALLSAFGTNFIKDSGSRAVKRQYDYTRSKPKEHYAHEYRAIPHNAILGQLGVLVNSFSGLGTAIKSDPSCYNEMLENSARFRILMKLVLRAVNKSHPDTMKAYIDTLDPMLWLMLEAQCEDRAKARKYARVAELLEKYSPSTSISRIFRKIYADFTAFCQCESVVAAGQGEEEIELACLNALRIALIHQAYLLAMDIPHYSPQHDIKRDQLIYNIIRLDIPLADKELREIFPVIPDGNNHADYGEESDFGEEEIYAYEQERIFDPLLKIHRMIQDISAAVTHHIGFLG